MRKKFVKKLKRRCKLHIKIIVFAGFCCWLMFLAFIEVKNSRSEKFALSNSEIEILKNKRCKNEDLKISEGIIN